MTRRAATGTAEAKARRAPDFKRFGPVAAAMFDTITELGKTSGAWVPVEDALAAGIAAVTPELALSWGTRDHKPDAPSDKVRASGARTKAKNDLMIAQRSERIQASDGKVRLSPEFAAHWRTYRGLPALSAARTNSPARVLRTAKGQDRVLGGWVESDAWAQAPLCQIDRVQFRATFLIPLADIRALLPAGVTAKLSHDGQYLIECAAGQGNGLRVLLDNWLREANQPHEGVRVIPNLYRRDLTLLPARFVDELYRVSVGPAKSRLSGSLSSLRLLVPEQDDVNQLVGLWILDAATQYDAEMGVPFGGFLANKLPHWVQDLNRAPHGRTAAEDELKLRRATAAFIQTHNRAPNDDELAEALGQDLATTRRKAGYVATIQGIRQSQPLLSPDDGGFEPVAAHDTEAQVLSDFSHALLSQTLVRATLGTGDDDNALGLIAAYFTTYGDFTMTDLAKGGHTSMRSIKSKEEAAFAAVRDRVGDTICEAP